MCVDSRRLFSFVEAQINDIVGIGAGEISRQSALTLHDKLDCISKVMRQYGFTVDCSSTYDSFNNSLHHLLTHNIGLPITLAILYVIECRKLYINAQGCIIPGHFLVNVNCDIDERIYIDCYNDYRQLTNILVLSLMNQDIYAVTLNALKLLNNTSIKTILIGCYSNVVDSVKYRIATYYHKQSQPTQTMS